MALTDLDRARFARQLLLPEIGVSGQERLLSARVRFAGDADPGVLAIAREYLRRAGVEEASEAASAVRLPDRARLEALAGDAELVEATRALEGALAAVEVVKALLDLGEPQAGARVFVSAEEA